MEVVYDNTNGCSEKVVIDVTDWITIDDYKIFAYRLSKPFGGSSIRIVGNILASTAYKILFEFYKDATVIGSTSIERGSTSFDYTITSDEPNGNVSINNISVKLIGSTGIIPMTVNFQVFMDNNIVLYNNKSENHRIDKTDYLTVVKSVSGTFRESISIISPVFDIEMEEFPNFNYLYIYLFNRYYYVDDIELVRTKLYRIYCHCDVLMSFKNDIKKQFVYTTRQEFNYNELMPDEKIPATMVWNNYYAEGEDSELLNVNNIVTYTGNNPNPQPFVMIASTDQQDVDTFLSPNTPFNRLNFMSRRGVSQLADFVYSANFIEAFGFDSASAQLSWNLLFEEPMDGLVGLRLYPFDFSRNFKGIVGENKIFIGKKEVSILPDVISGVSYPNVSRVYLSTNFTTYVYGGHIDLKKYIPNYNNFLGQPPYTVIELCIPYLGYVNIDITKFPTYDIALIYVIDVYANVCDVILVDKSFYTNTEPDNMKETMKYVVFTQSISMGIDVPLSATSENERVKSLAGLGIKTLGTVAGMVISGISGIPVTPVPEYTPKTHRPTKRYIERLDDYNQRKQEYKGNYQSKIPDLLAGATVDAITAMQLNYQTGQCGSGWNWWLRSNQLIVSVKQVRVDYPDNYAHYVGKPSSYAGFLSGVKGYTEVGGVHLENIKNATSEELDEIDNSLRSGVLV